MSCLRPRFGRKLRWALFLALFGSPGAALAKEAIGPCAMPPSDAGGRVNVHTRFIEQNLLPAVVEPDARPLRLSDRMRAYGVPGISVAVIHKGKIDWARGWGVRDTASCKPVTSETAFQAASISKVVTAVLALRLVQQGKLSLDGDIGASLRSWRIMAPAASSDASVSLRQLLSHTAGLNVHGFPGYGPGAAVPDALQVLSGQKPANTEAVRIISPPGSEWRYSGGGYLITQVALEDVTGMPFGRLARSEIFDRLGMRRSAFSQPPAASILANIASGHSGSNIIPGRYHIYPELAPAGLWTTAADLARLVLDLQRSINGQPGRLLSPAMATTMITPVKGEWGVGPALYGTGPGRRFGHDGVNEGFQLTMVAYVSRGEGVIVLTNAAGKRLADEIVRAVATDYGWDELASKPVVEARVPAATLAALAGRYEGGGLTVYLDVREGHLFAQTGGPEPERLIAISPTRFRTSVSGIVVEFSQEGSGFTIVEGGPPIRLTRTGDSTADPLSEALYIRGSMNNWGTEAPLLGQANGIMVAELVLGAGEHQLKIASRDWKSADLGLVNALPVTEPLGELTLIPHGGNIRLQLSAPGAFRFELKRGPTGPVLSIKRQEKR